VTPLTNPRPAIGFDSIVQQGPDLIVTIDESFTITFVNDTITAMLGYDPAEVIGHNIVDYLHPDELKRAMLAVNGWNAWGSPSGTAGFDLLAADGSWRAVDLTAAAVIGPDGTEQFALFGRSADYHQAINRVLARMLAGADRHDILAPILDVFTWRPLDAQVGIAWYEAEAGHCYVSTGIPPALVGADDIPGTPWAAVRDTGEPLDLRGEALHEWLGPETSALADSLGRGDVWIVPVPDLGSGVDALITIWGRAGGPPPIGHAYGMQMAVLYTDLILQWTARTAVLEAAARTDPLTGLANRRQFFEVLGSTYSSGALVFCDLDGFKPVNDDHGHAAGDEVLRLVAERLKAAIRDDDLVARTGGDEFVVLARGASPDQADVLAARLAAVADEPFALSSGLVLELGISVGLAQTDLTLNEQVLADADRALLAVKATKRDAPTSR
jgi:diguanylate cyclase (GGDEF)-like protein/PAS domain S-box-containing protein